MFGEEVAYDDGKRARRLELKGYWIDYYESGDSLVVAFDSAGFHQNAQVRKPWGFDFLAKRGYSVLGVKYKFQDWYRGADLHAFFRSEELRTLAGRHSRIYLFGGSMGGYAALTFAEVFPGVLMGSLLDS
jgi:alpha-beta hydrolase superfamily lysophospholipase